MTYHRILEGGRSRWAAAWLVVASLSTFCLLANAASGEPRIPRELEEMLHSALRQAHLGCGEERSWRRRVRWAALVPRLSAGVAHSSGRTEFWDLALDVPTDFDINARLGLRWDVRVSWEIERLVFDPQELRVAAAAERRAARRARLAERVIRLYFRLTRHKDGQEVPSEGNELDLQSARVLEATLHSLSALCND